MTPHIINERNNFIAGWTPDNIDICDKLIEYYEISPNKKEGERLDGVDKSKKDSIDCAITDNTLQIEYIEFLQPIVNEYIKLYPWCNEYAPWTITEDINIQHYRPGGGYHIWHTERGGPFENVRDRHLVFMTYLNDVTDEGETHWIHQDLKVKPQKGLTVIWPSDWTFTHKGITSNTQDKYIVTGWFSYIQPRI